MVINSQEKLLLTKIEAIAQLFDRVARTNEPSFATSQILSTKHRELDSFKLDYALKAVAWEITR